MTAHWIHGALAGAVLAGLAGLVEFLVVALGFPYHRDWGIWLTVLPLYLAAGAAVGLGVGVVFRWISRRQDREAFPGLFLTCAVLAALVTLIALVKLHLEWLPGTRFHEPKALAASLGVLAGGVALYGALTMLARRRRAWLVAGFFTPFAYGSGLAFVGVLAWIGWVMPVGNAPMGVGPRGRSPAAPNVLLIVLDTLRPDHLGCYGHERATSPNLDRIAAEGVLCESAFSAAPWTLPSHASLFTGLHATTHRAGWEHPRIEDGRARVGPYPLADFHTMADELGLRGYESCAMGQKAWVSYETGMTQGFSRVWDFSQPTLEERLFLPRLVHGLRARLGRGPAGPADKGAHRIVDQALAWLGGGRGRDEDRPFFLFMNLNEAHDPFQPPEEFESAFLPDTVPIQDYRDLDQSPPFRKEYICGMREFRPNEPEILRSMYDAEILYQDEQLGRLFEGLHEMGLMENTLLVVTADHGEEFGEHGLLGHQLALSDEMLRVPLLFRYPESLKAGTRYRGLFSLVDVFPTVLEFVSEYEDYPAEPTPELLALEGVNQLPALRGESDPPRDFVLAHYSNPVAHLKSYPCWDPAEPGASPLWRYARAIDCIRSQDQKLVLADDGTLDAYDLVRDPGEEGLGTLTANSAAVRRLRQRLEAQLNCLKQRRLILLDPMLLWRGAQTQVGPAPGRQTTVDAEQIGYVGSSDSGPVAADSLPPCPPRIFE